MINGLTLHGFMEEYWLESEALFSRLGCSSVKMGYCSTNYDISDSYFSRLAPGLDLYRATDSQIKGLDLSDEETMYLVALRAVLALGTWKYEGGVGAYLTWASLDDVCEAFKVAVRAVAIYCL